MIARLLIGIVTAVFWLVPLQSPASAGRRIALVLGNDAYRNLGRDQQLHNAISDARAMKAALERLRFEVVLGENLDRWGFGNAVSEFTSKLKSDDVAFFFYAGHGIAINSLNYLLPSDIPEPGDAAPEEESRIARLAYSEGELLGRLGEIRPRLAIVVLDSCRDNPLSSPQGVLIGASLGLAISPDAPGVLTIYSAGAGQRALDRLDDTDPNPNSVFTRVFVKKLTSPTLDVRAAALETQAEVAELARSVGHEQVPSISSQLLGEDLFLTQRPSEISAHRNHRLLPSVPETSQTGRLNNLLRQ